MKRIHLMLVAVAAFLVYAATVLFLFDTRADVSSQEGRIRVTERELRSTRCARLVPLSGDAYRFIPIQCPGGDAQSRRQASQRLRRRGCVLPVPNHPDLHRLVRPCPKWRIRQLQRG